MLAAGRADSDPSATSISAKPATIMSVVRILCARTGNFKIVRLA